MCRHRHYCPTDHSCSFTVFSSVTAFLRGADPHHHIIHVPYIPTSAPQRPNTFGNRISHVLKFALTCLTSTLSVVPAVQAPCTIDTSLNAALIRVPTRRAPIGYCGVLERSPWSPDFHRKEERDGLPSIREFANRFSRSLSHFNGSRTVFVLPSTQTKCVSPRM